MAYLGKTPSQAVRSRYYYTATGGETSLSGADDNSNVLTFTDGNYVDVSLNGVALVAGTDYNTTTANTIGGLTALVASDIVEVIVYDTFSVFGGNMAANLNFKDNVKANFGTGNDLQIFHDGSNSIIRDAGTGSLKFQYGTSDGVVFDSSGNVGIGTSSPSGLLHLSANTATTTLPSIVFQDTGTTSTRLGSLTNNNGDLVLAMTSSLTDLRSAITLFDDRKITFATSGSEKMRIDSSGQLIVGHNGAGSPYFNEGILLNPGGDSVFHRDGNSVVDFSRETSDGNIVRFVKDNSVVGSIGAYNSAIGVISGSAASYTGLYFNTDKIEPAGNNFGSEIRADNTVDIGSSSYRFKDLYLSGGVYLGGTGSANYLDDYEEGTFDVTMRRAGNAAGDYTVTCNYTKIGKIVTLNFVNDGTIAPYYNPTSGGTAAAGDSVEIVSSLPFTPTQGNNAVRLGHSRSLANQTELSIGIRHNSTAIYLGRVGVGNDYYILNNAVTDSAQANITILATLIYQTTN